MEMTSFESAVLLDAYAEIRRRFTGTKDLAHDWEHVSRVYTLALKIAEKEGANCFIVGMAALMHDLGHSPQHGSTKHHADLSVELATELLTSYQVPADTQELILHAIISHSFSRGAKPRTLEALVLRDADRLDSLGAIGILRWAVTGVLLSNPQTRFYHSDDPFGRHHNLDDRTYMLDHFFSKLLRLSDTMGTETGRQIAQKRTAFMHMYLNELGNELGIE
ncbi:MAG TPA: HD domain-containing protein [Ktedonobacteraceae bacterium]|jgi:uncharacterized protein|nr:HD domain-containing protein [Ktedonobacteraceae bacterium]